MLNYSIRGYHAPSISPGFMIRLTDENHLAITVKVKKNDGFNGG
jgi:hypothetical protein